MTSLERELLEVLKALIWHDVAADMRAGLEWCREIDKACDLISQLGEDHSVWVRELNKLKN